MKTSFEVPPLRKLAGIGFGVVDMERARCNNVVKAGILERAEASTISIVAQREPSQVPLSQLLAVIRLQWIKE
jgi:hypothetical protein